MEKSQNERLSSYDSLKTIAFSVYTHSRVVLPDIVRGILPKSMTRFGPASAMADLLNELERKEPIYYKVLFLFQQNLFQKISLSYSFELSSGARDMFKCKPCNSQDTY